MLASQDDDGVVRWKCNECRIEILDATAIGYGHVSKFFPVEATRVFRITMKDINEVVLLPKLVNYLERTASRLVIEAQKITVSGYARCNPCFYPQF